MTKHKRTLADRQGHYQRTLTGVNGESSEMDRFEVLHDLTYAYNYFFPLPDTATDDELRSHNAARKVVTHILNQSLQPGTDLLSRLFEEAVARRIDEQKQPRKQTHDDA